MNDVWFREVQASVVILNADVVAISDFITATFLLYKVFIDFFIIYEDGIIKSLPNLHSINFISSFSTKFIGNILDDKNIAVNYKI